MPSRALTTDLIFLMVFIALPTLQRSQRDTQRRNDLARVSTQLTQYQTNNSGRLPAAETSGSGNSLASVSCEPSSNLVSGIPGAGKDKDGKVLPQAAACAFIKNYMNSSTASDDAESEFVDPTGDPYKLTIQSSVTSPKNLSDLSSLDYNDKRVYIVYKARCDGETLKSTTGSRDYAIVYKLEGNGVYCQDNGS